MKNEILKLILGYTPNEIFNKIADILEANEDRYDKWKEMKSEILMLVLGYTPPEVFKKLEQLIIEENKDEWKGKLEFIKIRGCFPQYMLDRWKEVIEEEAFIRRCFPEPILKNK